MGSMLEEVQDRYQQHHHSCFLYLASEVIKVNISGLVDSRTFSYQEGLS